MKFTVNSNELSTLLQNVGRLVPASNVSMPALANYLFEVTPERISVTGGDTMMRSTGVIAPLECDGDMHFLIAPTPLLDYIKSLPVQPLTLEMQTTEEGARFIHLIHSTGYLDIPIGDAELYVSRESPEDSEGAAMMSMNSSSLLSGISAVLPAAYPDTSREQLHGVHFVMLTDRLELCATDNVQLVRYIDYDARIVEKEGEVAQASLKDPSFTLPIKVSSFLQSILPNFANEEALVIFNNKQVEVRFGAYNVVSQVSVLDFPNYNGLLPEAMTYMIEIDGQVLQRATTRVNYLSNIVGLGADSSLLCITFEEHAMVMKGGFYAQGANTPGVDVEERIPVDYPEQMEGMQITFKTNTFIKFLKAFNAESLQLHITNATQPIMITPTKVADQTDLRGITAPVRI